MGTGLYVHIPFCLSRCGYCTFVSGEYDPALADAYLAALAAEWREEGGFIPDTLFIGGGTPSALQPRQLARLLAFLPQPEGEATCELNPDSATVEKLRLLRDWGINRLSFGVQTFSPRGLAILGRRHDAATAREAVRQAVDMGFPAVNVDLIYGWPGQSAADLRVDVEESIALGVKHLSCYALILDASARAYDYYRTLLQGEEAEEEIGAGFWEFLDQELEARGFRHYETSNFAREGYYCRHNVHTWEGGEYLGIGLGAHSHRGGVRWANSADLPAYCLAMGKSREIRVFSEQLPPEEKARETAVFWLRLFRGIALARFRERSGFSFEALYRAELPGLLREELLEYAEGGLRIRVPRRRQIILDSILAELI